MARYSVGTIWSIMLGNGTLRIMFLVKVTTCPLGVHRDRYCKGNDYGMTQILCGQVPPDSISYYGPDGKIYNNGSTTSTITNVGTLCWWETLLVLLLIQMTVQTPMVSKNNSWINSGDPTSGSTGTADQFGNSSICRSGLPVAHGSGSYAAGQVCSQLRPRQSSFAGNSNSTRKWR